MAKICPNCRQHNADINHACAECGTSLADAEVTAAPPAVDEDAPLEPSPGAPGRKLAAKDPLPDEPEASERLLWSGRAAWKATLGYWAIYAVVLMGVLVLTAIYGMGDLAELVVWLVIIPPAIYLLFKTLYLRLSIGYRLTEQRLFIDRGILSRLTDQTELIRVDDVRTRQGPVQRLLGIGDIIVISTDATDNELIVRAVESPQKVAEHIRTQMRKLRKGGLYIEKL